MFTRVIVPLDGSANAAHAWPYGRLVAKATHAQLEVVWIVESFVDLARSRLMIGESDIDGANRAVTYQELQRAEEDLKAHATEELERVAAEAKAQGISVTTTVHEGRPADVIIDAAGSDEGTLICMGTHGRSGVARWMYGSVADRVIRHASASTLVVRSAEGQQRSPESIRRVIVPVDGSPLSERAVPIAVDMAKAFGTGVTVLRALDLGLEGTIPTASPGGAKAIDARQVREHGEAYVASVANRIKDAGVPDVDTKAIEKHPAEAIVDEVGEAGDRLVVMGSHGRSGPGRFLLGSVTDTVARHSRGPVLIVRSS